LPYDHATTPHILPPPATLAMPTQPVSQPAQARRWHEYTPMWLRRTGLFAATFLLTFAAFMAPYDLFAGEGFTWIEVAALVLFGPLFIGISCWFCSALAGFFLLATRRGGFFKVEDIHGASHKRTALLAVVRNEDVAAVYARLRAMDNALARKGLSSQFDFFVLSDTNKELVAAQEGLAAANAAASSHSAFYYRRRAINHGRKSGNVADWVRNFGGAYEYMIVLDADSLMSAELLQALPVYMDARPDLGVLQTIPMGMAGETLFARHMQFGIRLYGRVASAGVAWWTGAEGLFWGHNAILRTRAFAANAGLPRLEGAPPFGGEILSHDVIESMFMRRAGWGVEMAPLLEGSYEQCPPTLVDEAIRDRRWCQGNLQHLGLMRARGLGWLAKVQIAMAAMVYFAAPLWLAFLSAGIALRLEQGAPEPGEPWFSGSAEQLLELHWSIVLTVVMLFGPKVMGALLILARPEERRAFGGGFAVIAGLLGELVMSAVLAPMRMLFTCRAVAETLLGYDSGWNSQRRSADAAPWSEAWRACWWHTAIGVFVLALAAPYSDLVIWTAPILFGLVFSVPLTVLTSSTQAGMLAASAGVFLTPEEVAPPAVMAADAARPETVAPTPEQAASYA
jgi:membrane glycosyltransferase